MALSCHLSGSACSLLRPIVACHGSGSVLPQPYQPVCTLSVRNCVNSFDVRMAVAHIGPGCAERCFCRAARFLVLRSGCGCLPRHERSLQHGVFAGGWPGLWSECEGAVRLWLVLFQSIRWPCSGRSRRIGAHKKLVARAVNSSHEPDTGQKTAIPHRCFAYRSFGRTGPTSERKKSWSSKRVGCFRVVGVIGRRLCAATATGGIGTAARHAGKVHAAVRSSKRSSDTGEVFGARCRRPGARHCGDTGPSFLFRKDRITPRHKLVSRPA